MRPAPLYRRLDELTPEGNSYLHAWAANLLADLLPGVLDIVPAYASLYLEYDADLLTGRQAEDWLDGHEPAGQDMADQGTTDQGTAAQGTAAGREVRILVRYDGEDLPGVAAATGLSVPEVIALHSGTPYRVYAQGFVAGFPFLGEVAPALRLPRRASPRAQVPAHSVAMAAAQTGVYPVASPGGWHLLGHALEAVYDPNRAEPFLLGPGDTVRFVPAEGPVPPPISPLELLPAAPAHPLLRVDRGGPLSLVQDAGRVLAGRFGLVRGGFASPQAAQIANRLLGNVPDAPLLELHLGGPGCTVLTDCTLAVSGSGPQVRLDGVPAVPWSSFRARAGQRLDFRASGPGRVSYLAFAGGLDTARFRGSASTDLRGGIGRALRAGDVLGAAQTGQFQTRQLLPGRRFVPVSRPGASFRLLPMPGGDALVLAALCRSVWTAGDGDRMGLRLLGPALPGGETLSEGSPVGTVQVPPGGQPIILLHDKGTLGGYSKPARVHPGDLWRLADLRAGERIRFRPGD